jgi:hypothetical protein
MRRRPSKCARSTSEIGAGSCPVCGTSRRTPARHWAAALGCALAAAIACAAAGCDPACTVIFENHTARVVRVRYHADPDWLWEIQPCSVRPPHATGAGTCTLDWQASDEEGNAVPLQVVVSDGLAGWPINLFRAGVGSGECPEPPQAALYVVARNRSGLQALLQIDGRDAQPLPPDAERRLGPLPGNPAHKFYPQVTATDPDGRALGVERVSVEQPPDAVPVMTVDILPPEEREEK